MLTAKTKICLVVGYPVGHSLSPSMHNNAYKALGVEDEFVYLAANTQETARQVIEGVRALNIRGCAFTMPYKADILPFLDDIDEKAQEIGAVNTVVNEGGHLEGHNTDWRGVKHSLQKITELKGKKVAVIGAGGAARAAVFALVKEGADISAIFNRTPERAKNLARSFNIDCAIKDLSRIEETTNYEIVLNMTPLGMKGHPEGEGKTAIPKEFIKEGQIIFDVVYSIQDTRLIREAKEQGAKVVPGTEMVLYQAIDQLEFHIGRELNKEEREKVEGAMREAVEEARKESKREIEQELKKETRPTIS